MKFARIRRHIRHRDARNREWTETASAKTHIPMRLLMERPLFFYKKKHMKRLILAQVAKIQHLRRDGPQCSGRSRGFSGNVGVSEN